jgi:hypothetical protein
MANLKKLADLRRIDLDGVISPSTLRRKIQAGEVPHLRIAGRIFLEPRVISRVIRGRSIPASNKVSRR